MSRDELFVEIQKQPPEKMAIAGSLALDIFGETSRAPAGAFRDAAQRRAFAGDPWKYTTDILGWTLTPQQERVLEVVESSTRVLVPSANNVGKTWFGALYAVYRFDAVAALPDPEAGLEEQGARILLPGPSHDAVRHTIYAKILTHAARAEKRGFVMPGYRSERSVYWQVRPEWNMEVLSPPKKRGQAVAHTASGRHHANMVAIVEEGQGVVEPIWLAVEGMCSGHGNIIFSIFNPTESRGPAYARVKDGGWRVVHLDAFAHPNVRSRAIVVGGGAVSFSGVDERVRLQCRNRGPYPKTKPDPGRNDFVYALPPWKDGAPDPTPGARKDKKRGSPKGRLRVFRPNGTFEAQVLGQFPTASDVSLFQRSAWEAAVERWKASTDPAEPPDIVGCDPAREGADDTMLAPRWGPGAEELLRAHAEAEKESEAAVQRVRARRARIGELVMIPKGDGPSTARGTAAAFPASPVNVDEGGVGASTLDHLFRVLEHDAVGVSFSASPPQPVPGEPWSENLRTAMYVRASMAVNLGLCDVPPDPDLREECFAVEVIMKSRVAQTLKGREWIKDRVDSVLLIPKEQIIALIGRSPDRSDAFVLSLLQPERDRDVGGITAIVTPRRL